MVETSESPWNHRIFLGGNPGFLGLIQTDPKRDSLILWSSFPFTNFIFLGENRSTHVGPSINHQHMFLSCLQTRGPTIMRWVKPLCGAVTEIQSLNILRIQPRHMVAWRFVQYTPPGFKKRLVGNWRERDTFPKKRICQVALHIPESLKERNYIVTPYINYTPGNQTQLPNHDGSWSPCIPFQI